MLPAICNMAPTTALALFRRIYEEAQASFDRLVLIPSPDHAARDGLSVAKMLSGPPPYTGIRLFSCWHARKYLLYM